jgi:hypothetical protein
LRSVSFLDSRFTSLGLASLRQSGGFFGVR